MKLQLPSALVDKISKNEKEGFSNVHVIEELIPFSIGRHRTTGGMVGGSGYTLYLPDDSSLRTLLKQCRALTKGCRQRLAKLKKS